MHVSDDNRVQTMCSTPETCSKFDDKGSVRSAYQIIRPRIIAVSRCHKIRGVIYNLSSTRLLSYATLNFISIVKSSPPIKRARRFSYTYIRHFFVLFLAGSFNAALNFKTPRQWWQRDWSSAKEGHFMELKKKKRTRKTCDPRRCRTHMSPSLSRTNTHSDHGANVASTISVFLFR